jgi:hypothetical protein
MFSITVLLTASLGSILVKRIFPPTLDDFEEYSKQAHYSVL